MRLRVHAGNRYGSGGPDVYCTPNYVLRHHLNNLIAYISGFRTSARLNLAFRILLHVLQSIGTGVAGTLINSGRETVNLLWVRCMQTVSIFSIAHRSTTSSVLYASNLLSSKMQTSLVVEQSMYVHVTSIGSTCGCSGPGLCGAVGHGWRRCNLHCAGSWSLHSHNHSQVSGTIVTSLLMHVITKSVFYRFRRCQSTFFFISVVCLTTVTSKEYKSTPPTSRAHLALFSTSSAACPFCIWSPLSWRWQL